MAEAEAELLEGPDASPVMKLVEATQLLTVAVSRSEESRKKDRTVYLALISVLLLITVPILIILIQFTDIAKTSRNTNKSTNENSQIIKDCVTPTGACYQRNAQRTASLLIEVIDSNRDGIVDSKELLTEIIRIEDKLGIIPSFKEPTK